MSQVPLNRTRSLRRSLLFGGFYSLVGLAVGWVVSLGMTGEGFNRFYLYSGPAAFVTAALFWYLYIEKYNRRKYRNGVLAGALSGVLSHFLCWLLLMLESQLHSGGTFRGVGDFLFVILYLSIISLFSFGPITVLWGVFAGWLFTREIAKGERV